jgi:hypothetical protein
MTRHRRAVVIAMVAAGFSMFAGAASAHAETPDEVFIEAVNSLGIEMAPDIDLPAVGNQVCDMLAKGITGNPNPVPAVRGVVATLASNNMEREQAVGLMKASVAVYCPQYSRFVGR